MNSTEKHEFAEIMHIIEYLLDSNSDVCIINYIDFVLFIFDCICLIKVTYELPEDVGNIIDWWWIGSPKNEFVKNMVYTGNLNGSMPNQNNMAGVHLLWLARCIYKQRITAGI